VSKKRIIALGISRLNASAPAGRKKGSFFPHTARKGGLCVRKAFGDLGDYLLEKLSGGVQVASLHRKKSLGLEPPKEVELDVVNE
jgi:hypothetical protein